MTPEERSASAAHAAKRGAKKLGKEGRAARSAKGWETRREKEADVVELRAYVVSIIRELGAGGASMHLHLSTPDLLLFAAHGKAGPTCEVVRAHKATVESRAPKKGVTLPELIKEANDKGPWEPLFPPKPKRALPDLGTMTGRVLSWLQFQTPDSGGGGRLAADIAVGIGQPISAVRNALPALQRSGRVVSEPMPGSRREKLWRLA